MPSRQLAHRHEASLRQLRTMVPHDCPLLISRIEPGTTSGFFTVRTLDTEAGAKGRFEVVAAWIAGYVAAWGTR